MKRILFSALALGAMTTAAAAEPQAMSDDQLAGVAAGVAVVQDITQSQAAFGLALDLGGGKGLPICCVLPIDGGNGGASVDIDQTQTALNNAVVTVTRTATDVVPEMPDASSGMSASSLPNGGVVGFSTTFNHRQNSN